MTKPPDTDPRTQAEKPLNERTGWILVGIAVAILVVEFAAIPYIRSMHSSFMAGLIRGLGLVPVFVAVSGARMISASRKARKANPVV